MLLGNDVRIRTACSSAPKGSLHLTHVIQRLPHLAVITEAWPVSNIRQNVLLRWDLVTNTWQTTH